MAGVVTGVGAKACRLEQTPGEKLGEELRSEHRTHVSWAGDRDAL